MLAERGGFDGSHIYFSSNVTPAAEYQLARRLGATINLDDISHIDFLNECADIPESICCRFNPGGSIEVANGIMDNPGDAKYGMTRTQLADAFRRLMKLGVKRFGLHAFLVSNALTELYYPLLARLLFRTAVELRDETGAEITSINLSGGIGIPMRPEQSAVDIQAVGDGVRSAFEEILTPAGMGSVAIYTELGRFMTGPYGMLVSTAIHRKSTHKEYVGLDSCAVDLMRPAIYGAYHHITVSGKREAKLDCTYDVTGSLCENNDKFAIDRNLPKIDVGDLIIIHDTGAHGYSMGYNYNGKLKSKELLLSEDGSVKLIRRAETPDDYFATMVF
jgi:diaminopimelate decarboxylase